MAVPMGWVDSWEGLVIPVVSVAMVAAGICVVWEVAKTVIAWWRGMRRAREIRQAYENLKKDDAPVVASGQQSLAEVLSSADARLWQSTQGNFSPDRPTIVLLFDDGWPLSQPTGVIEYDCRTATKAIIVQPPQSLDVSGTSSNMLLALRTDAVVIGVNAAWLCEKSTEVLSQMLQWHRATRHYRNEVSVILFASQQHIIPQGSSSSQGLADPSLARLQQSLHALQSSFNVTRIRIAGIVDSQSSDGLAELLSAAGADDWILAPGQEYPTLASSGQVESSAQAIDHWLAKRRTLAFADLAIAQKRGAVPHCFPAQQLRQEMAKVIAINGVLRKWVHALCRLYRGITFGNSQLLADNRPIIIPHDQKLTLSYLRKCWRG